MNKNRLSAGAPASRGGQYTHGVNPVADLDVVGSSNDAPPDPEEVMAAEPDLLWDYVRHPDPAVRSHAAAAINLTTDQLHELSDPQLQPTEVRFRVAQLPNPGVAARAMQDPSPTVRAQASLGWDLPSGAATTA